MNLDDAINLISQCAQRMNALYGGTVFDEWVIIQVRDKKACVVWYTGPRQTTFTHEVDGLKELLNQPETGELGYGDFNFERHAVGTQADALMVLGPNTYLICNNTKLSMNQITPNPLWLRAQVPFAELGEKFRLSPLVLDET